MGLNGVLYIKCNKSIAMEVTSFSQQLKIIRCHEWVKLQDPADINGEADLVLTAQVVLRYFKEYL